MCTLNVYLSKQDLEEISDNILDDFPCLVGFLTSLLAKMVSSPVVRMVMVTSMITSYALTCKVSHFSGVSSFLHVLAHLSIAS
jgi:hypothetical protein